MYTSAIVYCIERHEKEKSVLYNRVRHPNMERKFPCAASNGHIAFNFPIKSRDSTLSTLNRLLAIRLKYRSLSRVESAIEICCGRIATCLLLVVDQSGFTHPYNELSNIIEREKAPENGRN